MPDSSVDAIRTEAERFMAARVRPRSADPRSIDGEVYTLLPRGDHDEQREVQAAKSWQRELFAAGLAWVDGPVEYGGRGLSPEHARAVTDVAAQYDVPSPGPISVGLDIVRPTVLAAGTPEQRERWLPGIVRGDLVCCQLFSEPEAGSDLAGLRTTARRDRADAWTVTGQKVWSSGAHYSDIGLLLARTGTAAERGRGLTLFMIPMRQPGVQVRPLRQMSGGAHFNEVFLDDAQVDEDGRLGAVGAGWSVAMSTLTSERSAAGQTVLTTVDRPTARLYELAREADRLDDPEVRESIAESALRDRVLRRTVERFANRPDDLAGASVVKLLVGQNMRLDLDAAERLLGPRLVADDGTPGTYTWSHLLLSAPAHRIAGGTDEIQRNILAERVLGLPREAPRPTPQEQN